MSPRAASSASRTVSSVRRSASVSASASRTVSSASGTASSAPSTASSVPPTIRRSARISKQGKAATEVALKPVAQKVSKKVKFNESLNKSFADQPIEAAVELSHRTPLTPRPIIRRLPLQTSSVGSSKPNDANDGTLHVQPYGTRRLIYRFDYSVPGNPYKTTFNRDPNTGSDTLRTRGRRGKGIMSQAVLYLAKDMDFGPHFKKLPTDMRVLLHSGEAVGYGAELDMGFAEDVASGREMHVAS